MLQDVIVVKFQVVIDYFLIKWVEVGLMGVVVDIQFEVLLNCCLCIDEVVFGLEDLDVVDVVMCLQIFLMMWDVVQ